MPIYGWSHTSDGLDAASQNVHDAEREWLEIVFAEWQAAKKEKDGSWDLIAFNQARYTRGLKRAKKFDKDDLADYIWEKMESLQLCENGMSDAWCCPYGCHTVKFDVPETAEEKDYWSDIDGWPDDDPEDEPEDLPNAGPANA